MRHVTKTETFGRLVQLFGSFVCGAGVALEIILQADWVFILVTAGSFLFAVGTKLAYYRKQ